MAFCSARPTHERIGLFRRREMSIRLALCHGRSSRTTGRNTLRSFPVEAISVLEVSLSAGSRHSGRTSIARKSEDGKRRSPRREESAHRRYISNSRGGGVTFRRGWQIPKLNPRRRSSRGAARRAARSGASISHRAPRIGHFRDEDSSRGGRRGFVRGRASRDARCESDDLPSYRVLRRGRSELDSHRFEPLARFFDYYLRIVLRKVKVLYSYSFFGRCRSEKDTQR